MMAAGNPDHAFEDFDENTRATTFYTTGTTGNPEGVYYSHRQLVLHTPGALAGLAAAGSQGRFHRSACKLRSSLPHAPSAARLSPRRRDHRRQQPRRHPSARPSGVLQRLRSDL